LRRPVGSVVEPNETGILLIHFDIHLTSVELDAVQAGDAPLWLYFAIVYRDYMHKRHEARFCYQWARSDGAAPYYFAEGDAPAAYTQHT
jgi:hypothetical protein